MTSEQAISTVGAATERDSDQEFGPERFYKKELCLALTGQESPDAMMPTPILPMRPQELFEYMQRFRNFETVVHPVGQGDERAYYDEAYVMMDAAVRDQDPEALIRAASFLVSSVVWQ